MVRSAQVERPPSELLFDTNPETQIPVGAQIGRWLRIADLSFRGAYPWVLLAPYVFWLASRFLVERGRLRICLPVHVAACALFALASQELARRSLEKRKFVVVVSEHREGKMVADGFLTNGARVIAEPATGEQISVHSYTSHLGTVGTKVVVTASSDGRAISAQSGADQYSMATNYLPPELLHRFGPDAEREALPKGSHSQWLSSNRYESRLFPNLLNVLAYGSLAGIAHAVHFYRRSRERERRAVLLESHLAKARLCALQAQLQPHFLFNALNAVATLLRRDPRAAQEALTSFSELLRLALSQSEKQEVSLREDLLFVERYVEIQQTRLGERLRFEQCVDSSALDCLVPTLFLQPLVENAIRHGIEPSSSPGLVRIVVAPNGERLQLSVEDNGVGIAAEEQQHNTGIGMSNLRARLDALYGGEHKVEVVPRAGGGVMMRLEIPLRSGSVNDQPQA
jgi:two-component sensor histidine kinase